MKYVFLALISLNAGAAEHRQYYVSGGKQIEVSDALLRAMRDNKRQTSVVLKMKGPKAPIKVTCGGSSFGLLMPIRDSEKWGPEVSEAKESVAS